MKALRKRGVGLVLGIEPPRLQVLWGVPLLSAELWARIEQAHKEETLQ
jgi:hypothetical protein